jgi:chitosanase
MSNIVPFIKKVLLAFEQSSTSIKYDKIYTWNDGPKNIKQITLSFGITEYGNLKRFVEKYCNADGKFKDKFQKYIPLIGNQSLVANKEFMTLLKESASDDIMKECQEQAYEEYYINPALKWCEQNQFNLNLSKLVIADSFLQSGSILKFLRNKFAEKTPKDGGKEEVWIKEYCKARHAWLSAASLQALRNSVYRANMFLKCIEKNDWELNQPKYNANGVDILR